MELFKLGCKLFKYHTFSDFASDFKIESTDLIITNQFIYDPIIKESNANCNVIFQERYGNGEPSDEMMNGILNESKKYDFKRIIAVGGGTVIDIAKILVLKDIVDVKDAFERKVPLIKDKALIAVPTTCGTGTEVTNISIAEIKSKKTKMGLAVPELFPDAAVLIPEFLKNLPYKFYMYSSIDALIHACESYLSPKANVYTKLYAVKAIETILDIYINMKKFGEEYRFERLEDVLIASNCAGIAFSNTGVGAVHALSYPMGGNYHVPHGLSNYLFFTEIFKLYTKKNPSGTIKELNRILSGILGCESSDVYDRLEILLGKLLQKGKLSSYGMKEREIEEFAKSVITNQQRLLANNYVPLSDKEIETIYRILL